MSGIEYKKFELGSEVVVYPIRGNAGMDHKGRKGTIVGDFPFENPRYVVKFEDGEFRRFNAVELHEA